MRAAARLTAAGCRVFRSSVAGAQSRVSSGSLARSLVGIPMGGGLGSSWESIRKHGRESLPCAARFGSSGVRLGRSHNNFGVASLAGLP